MNIPEELKIGVKSGKPYQNAMTIESTKNEPVHVSSTFSRWVIPNVGILDSDSSVQFSVHNIDAAADNLCFLPPHIGARACIKSAVLKIGSQVICRSEDTGYMAGIDNLFVNSEHKERIGVVQEGLCDSFEPSDNGDGSYRMKTAVYSAGDGKPSSSYGRLTSSRTNTPIYSVRLSQLFLFMKSRRFPVFALGSGQNLILEITWQSQPVGGGGTLCLFQSGYVGSTEAVVGVENQLFLSDHLLYNDETMSSILESINKDGLVMQYNDMLVTRSQTLALAPAPVAGTVQSQTVVNPIGISGKSVKAIYCIDNDGSDNTFTGKYKGYVPRVDTSEQWIVNDKQHYQRSLTSVTRKMDELGKVRGRTPDVLAPIYSLDARTNKADIERPFLQSSMSSTETFFGRTQADAEGSCFCQGVNLSYDGLGTTIGQKPVEHRRTFSRIDGDNPTLTTRYFVVYERIMSLKSGVVNVV